MSLYVQWLVLLSGDPVVIYSIFPPRKFIKNCIGFTHPSLKWTVMASRAWRLANYQFPCQPSISSRLTEKTRLVSSTLASCTLIPKVSSLAVSTSVPLVCPCSFFQKSLSRLTWSKCLPDSWPVSNYNIVGSIGLGWCKPVVYDHCEVPSNNRNISKPPWPMGCSPWSRYLKPALVTILFMCQFSSVFRSLRMLACSPTCSTVFL